MWSGVDPDVELFASGKVLDDDGEWGGGHPLGNDGNAAGMPCACCWCHACVTRTSPLHP